MDSQDTVLSSDNWLLNYVEIGKTIRPPLDSRVRTHMWVFHHFFSEFAKSKEAMEKEREPQQENNQECQGNRPDGGKLGRAVGQRIARKSGKSGSPGGLIREDGKRRNVSDMNVLVEISKQKLRVPSVRGAKYIPTIASCSLLGPPDGVYPIAAREYSLPVKYVELPDTTSDTSSSSASPPQPVHQPHRCNFWTEVFFNNMRYLVLNTGSSSANTAQNPVRASSPEGLVSRKDCKRKRDGECDVTSSSPKRLHN